MPECIAAAHEFVCRRRYPVVMIGKSQGGPGGLGHCQNVAKPEGGFLRQGLGDDLDVLRSL